jgi:hypothetical protein
MKIIDIQPKLYSLKISLNVDKSNCSGSQKWMDRITSAMGELLKFSSKENVCFV